MSTVRSPAAALFLSIMCAVGSVIGADPVITTASVVIALLKCARAWTISRRTAVPAAKPERRLYPYRLQFMR